VHVVDEEADAEVDPVTVQELYNEMVQRLEIYDETAQTVADVVNAAREHPSVDVTPTGRKPFDWSQYIAERWGGVERLTDPKKPIHQNYILCYICNHTARAHTVPSGYGGSRFPLYKLICDDCPNHECVLPDDPYHPGRGL
jgi:hypothetical protein